IRQQRIRGVCPEQGGNAVESGEVVLEPPPQNVRAAAQPAVDGSASRRPRVLRPRIRDVLPRLDHLHRDPAFTYPRTPGLLQPEAAGLRIRSLLTTIQSCASPSA